LLSLSSTSFPTRRSSDLIINKFDAAVKNLAHTQADSPNIFVLIDEAHRTQHGVFNVNMERVLPNACFVVFTGTPLMKKQKNTAEDRKSTRLNSSHVKISY